MTPTAAVIAARKLLERPVTLAARPRGVLHVYAGPLTPSGCSPRGSRPVCGRRSRRLHDVGTEPSHARLGAHVSGRPLCRACDGWLSRRTFPGAGAAQPLPHTAESVVWSVYAATSVAELESCRRTLRDQVPIPEHHALVELPAAAARRWNLRRISPRGALVAERRLIEHRAWQHRRSVALALTHDRQPAVANT